jgi:CubicO group peptidase (beta-lactamase class C family)
MQASVVLTSVSLELMNTHKNAPHHSAVLIGVLVAVGFAGTVTLRGALASANRESKAASVRRLDDTTITPAEIDATVTRVMAAGRVTGIGIAILTDGTITYQKAYGIRDKQKDLPLTTDSVMSAASFTKVAFSYLVM